MIALGRIELRLAIEADYEFALRSSYGRPQETARAAQSRSQALLKRSVTGMLQWSC